MPRRSRNGLTRNQNRLLRVIADGGTLHADRRRPQLVFVHGKGESFRTQRSVLRGLIQDDLLLVVGDDMCDVQATQKGLSVLDRLGGYPRRKLPVCRVERVRGRIAGDAPTHRQRLSGSPARTSQPPRDAPGAPPRSPA